MRTVVNFFEGLSPGTVVISLWWGLQVLMIGTGSGSAGFLLFGSEIVTMVSIFALVVCACVWDVRRARKERRATMSVSGR